MWIKRENYRVINHLAMPLVCILGIQSGYAIAQARPTEPSEAVPTVPSVTQVLPANVTGVLLLNNQSQAWQNVSRFLPIPPDFAAPGFVPHLPPEINFATQIKPWLGDWTAQVLMPNSQSTPNSPGSHRTLTLAPVTDASRLPQFIEQVKQQRSEPPIEREYQGVKILVWPEKVVPQGETMPPLPPKSGQSKSLGQIFPQTLFLDPNQVSDRLGSMVSSNVFPGLSLEKAIEFPWQSSFGRSLVKQKAIEYRPIAPLMANQQNPPLETIPQVMPGLAIAVVPGYLAAAETVAPIEQWLNSREGGITLAENPQFQKTLENPDFSRSLFVGYGEISGLAQSFLDRTFDPNSLGIPLPIPDVQELQNALGLLGETYSSGEFFAWFQPEGFRAKSRIYYKNPQDTTAIDPMGNDIYRQIPAATYLSLSGKNFNQLFLGLFRGLLNQPAIAEVWATLGNNPNSVSGNIDKNMIPWLDGEYAIFLFPTSGGLFPTFDPRLQLGMGFIAQTKDPAAAKQALQKLDDLAVRSSSENIRLKQEILNGQPVTEWQVFNPQRQSMESLLSYTWLDNRTLIVTTGLTPLKELHPKPYLSLDRAFTFTTATNPLPTPNNGYFYVNVGSLLSLVNNFLDPRAINNDPMLALGTSILGNIRSLTLSTSSTTTSTQSDFFIVLSPRRPIP